MGVFKRFLFALALVAGCGPDYSIVGHDEIYIKVHEEVIVEDTGVEDTGTPIGDIWVDSFEQPETTNGVDILWVIDTSCSMGDNQERLLGGIEEMMLNLPEADWRLNMISASPDVVAGEQQFPLVPGDTIKDAEYMYEHMAVGSWEQGFSSVEEYILYNSYAQTWLRWDAALLVVFVSDEEEQSGGTVGDFVYWLDFVRSTVYVSSIVNLTPSESLCSISDVYTGQRYQDATNAFNGVITDICFDDWTEGVRDASVQIDPISEWSLTHVPIKESIVVFMDGVPFMDWQYHSNRNEITFDVIPDGGSLVEIGYRYL